MPKFLLIARREYFYNFRRRAFLFTAFGVPAFTVIMMFFVFILAVESSSATGGLGTVGYVDHAGLLANPVEQPEEFIALPDEDAAQAAFQAGEIGAYFVITEEYWTNGQVISYAQNGIPEGIEDQIESFLQTNVSEFIESDVPLERMIDPLSEQVIVLLNTGERMEGEDDFLIMFLTPYIFAIIFMMGTMTTSQFLMSSVVEEKETRMMEILVTSSTPLEMLWGKVIGLGLLGLTAIGIWGVAGLTLSLVSSAVDSGPFAAIAGVSLPPSYLLLALVCFVLGYLLYASIMAGVGAAVTSEQEGQQTAAVLNLFVVLPLILSFSFLQDPNGTLPVVLTLIPLTAPLTIIIRAPLTAIPVWQLLLSLGLLVLASMVTVWISSRVFRLGMLMYGKRLNVREVWQAVRQGRGTVVRVEAIEGEM